MFRITKAINKFADELDYGFNPQLELVKIYATALIEDARENGELLSEVADEEDDDEQGEDDEVESTARIYVDVVPRFDKIKEAFNKLAED